MVNKTDLFFELLSAVYGRAKMAAQWPTERDEQIIRALVHDKVEAMTVTEIREAIDNARIQRMNEIRGFEWPDVDLILAGSKRFLCPAHREYLAPPEPVLPPKEERAAMARKILMDLGI